MQKTRHHSTASPTACAARKRPAAGDGDARTRDRYGDPPADAPLGTPGPGKRLMVSRACDTCKLRKGKCSGTLPCASCTKKGIACRYESRYARGRPPTPVPTTPLVAGAGPGPFTDGSVSSVYSPLQATSSSRRAQPTPGPEEGPPPPAPPPPQPSALPSRASPVLGMTEIQGQYVEPTSGLAFLHRAWKRISRQRPRAVADEEAAQAAGGDERQQRQDRAGDKAFADGDESSSSSSSLLLLPLPDLATCRQLVGYYHDLCVATYRFLHRPSVDAWLEQAHANVAGGRPLEHGLGAMKAAVVLCVLAVAMFHQGKSGGAPDGEDGDGADDVSTRKSDRLFLAATRVADAATGYPGLDSVQARLVQVLYLLHTSRLNQAWYVFGHALQTMAALGLHRRARRPTGRAADYIEAQCRKRAFWVAYILDTYLGIMFGRPRHFHDENIDQELPDAVNDEDMTAEGAVVRGGVQDCAMESLIFHARIGRIVGHISQSVYALHQDPGGGDDALARRVQAIRADLAAWTASLPAILSAVNPHSLVFPFRRQAITMRLARAHAVMHLNRPFLLRGPATGHGRENATAAADCLAAAREVLGIVDGMAQDGTLFYAFWWTHYVAFCALTVVYVWAIQGAADTGAADTDAADTGADADDNGLIPLAEQCRRHLARATARNSPSRRYCIILEELRQEAHGRAAARGDREARQAAQSLQAVQQAAQQAGATGATTTTPLDAEAFGGPAGLPSAPDYDPAAMPAYGLLPSPWDGWQTIDWMDIDALALDPFSGLATSPASWISGSLPLSVFGQ